MVRFMGYDIHVEHHEKPALHWSAGDTTIIPYWIYRVSPMLSFFISLALRRTENMTRRRISVVFYLLSALLAGGARESYAQDPMIHLEALVFDPLHFPELPTSGLKLGPENPTDRWIIQFHAPSNPEQRQMLMAKYGLRLEQYIPNSAYIERIPKADLAHLQETGLVRAVVPYHPFFKFSTRIGTIEFRTSERKHKAGFLLRAVLFDDADPATVAAAIQGIPGASQVQVQDFRPEGADARIELTLVSLARLPNIAWLEGVRWIEEVAEQIENNGNTPGTIQSGTPGTVPIWKEGLHGEGQIVGVIDGGQVDMTHCMFLDDIDNKPGKTHRKMLEVRGDTVTFHATFVAGIVAGDPSPKTFGGNRGNAWAARLVSGCSDEGIFRALVSNRLQGAKIHTNSWHDNTAGQGKPATYNQTAADTDTFLWNNQDHLVLGSMGNEGEEQGPPGTAKNAVAVNASSRDPDEMNLGDGTPGPTADGRRKPDVVAPGCQITSAIRSLGCIVKDWNDCATSWATPAAAAAAALIRQYYTEGWYPTGTKLPQNARPDASGALLKATLLNATIDMTGVDGYPSNDEGWGLIRLNDALYFPTAPRRLKVLDVLHAAGLETGKFQTLTVQVVSSIEPLKVTLVWSDAPGTTGSAISAVNNLDLKVIAPISTTYQGNVFAGGQSTSGGTPDTVNNVEQVLINNPVVGTWTIRVEAPRVSVGPRQGFAVVASGALAL
ncbi:MAG TPA: S8 family serine peptidase [Thermoanaerobaculia bacterium]|nr:S8 family serine peptidase [Thermoanaerobaculia bacterium]